ncbi:MAG: hypothetical protein IPM92_12325 [Saprospiraceae bacterium]|nr:hypothetical protein [Saprospiraceae bacterium]
MKESAFRTELKATILAKEKLREQARLDLVSYAKESLEKVNPIQLLKSAVAGHYKNHSITGDLLGLAMSLSAGYFSKKVLLGSSHSHLRKVLGNALMLAVTGISSANMDNIRETGNSYFQKMKGLFKKPEHKV